MRAVSSGSPTGVLTKRPVRSSSSRTFISLASRPGAARRLSKSLRPSTVLVLLTDSVTPELATVASRCVQDRALPGTRSRVGRMATRPSGSCRGPCQQGGARRGWEPGQSASASGRPERGRTSRALAASAFAARRHRSDGRPAGRGVARGGVVAVDPLRARHAAELEELAARAKAAGEKGHPRPTRGRGTPQA